MSSQVSRKVELSPLRRVGAVALGALLVPLRFLRNSFTRLFVSLDFYRKAFFQFTPQPGDIFIASYPRSGTTWLQMILYQLTTDGDMENLTHISEYCPFFEQALALAGPGAFDRIKSKPRRLFKTHMRYRWTPLGPARCIYVAREGKDVLVSWYYHNVDGLNYRGTFDRYAEMFIRGKVFPGSWFRHVAEWYAHRNDPNIIFLTYEDLSSDLEGTVRRIIDFCGLEVAPESLPRILERCSFSYMKKYEPKFSPTAELELLRGIKRDAFIRKGKVGGWREHMTPGQAAEFDRVYEETLGRLDLNLKEPKPVPLPLAHAPGRMK